MKISYKKFLPIILSSAFCLVFTGCGANDREENISSSKIQIAKSPGVSENNNSSIINNQSENANSENDKEKNNPLSFCKNLKLEEDKLEELLKYTIGEKEDKKEYKLVPVMNNDDDKDYWTNLVTKDEDYVKTFFLGRHILSKKNAHYMFSETMRHMWKTDPPIEMFFKVYLNGERCGIFMCDYLDTKNDVEFAYMTEKKFTNKKVASTSVQIIINLLKHLNETEFYDIDTVSLWIFDDNAASIKVAKNNGFKFVEKDPPNKRSKYSLNIKS